MTCDNVTRRKFIVTSVASGLAGPLGMWPKVTSAQATKPRVILRALSSQVKTSVYAWGLHEFARRVEKNSNGEIKIEWRGGPEAVPIFQGADAVSKGLFDIFHTTGTFHASIVPEANATIYEPKASPKALRESGAVALLDQIHREKLGLRFVGFSMSGPQLTILTREPVTDLAFFKGRKIRSTPVYLPLIAALDATAVTISPVEMYTALQRGVVDAMGWPAIGIEEVKLQEVVKFMMRPFYWALRWMILVNQRVHDRLEPRLQKILHDSMLEVEAWSDKAFLDEQAKEFVRLQKGGMTITDLPAADGRAFVETSDRVAWDAIVRNSPKYGVKLKELFQKAANKP